MQNIPLKKIDPNPGQPREHFTGLEELADSIKTEGLLEPIMVRPSSKAGKCFQIVHGERRYRASKLAGLADIPAIVREVDDKTMFRLSLVENVQRDALTAMEEAQAYARLQEQGYTQVEIGHIIGKGQSYVAHKLRLLKVPDVLTHYLSVGQLTKNHFRQAMRLKNIIGEDISEEWVAIPAEDPRDFRATAMSLLIFRPYGRLVTALPMRPRSRAYVEAEAAVIDGVKRFDEYVSKHTPTPVWHRIAFWWLSAMVGYQWTVVEAGRYIDDYERLIYSQVVWHSSRMGKKDPAQWGSYEWAVYHDLKHAGLMDTVGTGSKL